MLGFTGTETIQIALVAFLVCAPWIVLFGRVGYPGWWGLVAIVPGVNVFAWVMFLVVKWPIEVEIAQHRSPGLDSPEDEKVQAGWELQRLSKRAAALIKMADRNHDAAEIEKLEESGFLAEQFAAQTTLAVQQFAERTRRDAEQAASLLAQVNEAASQIRGG